MTTTSTIKLFDRPKLNAAEDSSAHEDPQTSVMILQA
jgi:hypothetical protein